MMEERDRSLEKKAIKAAFLPGVAAYL